MPKKKQKSILLWSDVRGDEALLRDDDNALYVFNEIKKGNYTAGSVSLHPINSAQKYSLYAAGHKGNTRYLYAEFFIEKTQKTLLYLVCDFMHEEYKRLSSNPHLEKIDYWLNDNDIQDSLARKRFYADKIKRDQEIKAILAEYNLKNNILVTKNSFIYLKDKQKAGSLQSHNIHCIVGCAGSGKTLKLVKEMIDYAKNYPEKDIFFVTETQKTVDKINELLNNHLSALAMEKITITTYKDLAESHHFTSNNDFFDWFKDYKIKNKEIKKFIKNNLKKICNELPIITRFSTREEYIHDCEKNSTLFHEEKERAFVFNIVLAYQNYLVIKNTFNEKTFSDWYDTYLIENQHHDNFTNFIKRNKEILYGEIIRFFKNEKSTIFSDKKNVGFLLKISSDYQIHLNRIKKIEILFHRYKLNKDFGLMILEEMQLISPGMALSLLNYAENALLSFDPLQTLNNCFPRTKVFTDRYIYESVNINAYRIELFEPKEIDSVKETLAKKRIEKNTIYIEFLDNHQLSYKLSGMGNKTAKINLLEICRDKTITDQEFIRRYKKEIIKKIISDGNIIEKNTKDHYTHLEESERCPKVVVDILNEKIYQLAIYSGGLPNFAMPIKLPNNNSRIIKGEAEWLEWDEQTIREEAKQLTLLYLNNPSVVVIISNITYYEEANELFTSTFVNPNTQEIEKISLIISPPDGVIGQDIDTVIVYDRKHPESEEMKDFHEINKKFTENFAKNAKANYQGIKSFSAENQLKTIYFYQEIEKISRTVRKIIHIGQANLNEITKRDRKLYTEYPRAEKKPVDVTIENIKTLELNREKNLAEFHSSR